MNPYQKRLLRKARREEPHRRQKALRRPGKAWKAVRHGH